LLDEDRIHFHDIVDKTINELSTVPLRSTIGIPHSNDSWKTAGGNSQHLQVLVVMLTLPVVVMLTQLTAVVVMLTASMASCK
jgi:hypothetical protein